MKLQNTILGEELPESLKRQIEDLHKNPGPQVKHSCPICGEASHLLEDCSTCREIATHSGDTTALFGIYRAYKLNGKPLTPKQHRYALTLLRGH